MSSDRTPPDWEGRARMAEARRVAGHELDDTDLEAIRQHPNPGGWVGETGAINLLAVAMAFLLGLAIVVALMLFARVDDHTDVDAIAPAPPRDLAEPTTTTSTTSTTTTTIEVLAERVEAHTKAAAVAVAPGSIEAQIVAAFSQFGADVATQAVDVADCESVGLNPGATGKAGERGLFQIHGKYHQERIRRLGFTWDQMYEVGPNIAVAVDLYAEQGWSPWTCAP